MTESSKHNEPAPPRLEWPMDRAAISVCDLEEQGNDLEYMRRMAHGTDPVNDGERLVAVLLEFGFGAAGVTSADLAQPRKVFRMGVPPNRIELITTIDGVVVPTISLEDLKTNKRASRRHRDLDDLSHLP